MWDILSKRTSLEIWHSYSRLPSHPCSVPLLVATLDTDKHWKQDKSIDGSGWQKCKKDKFSPRQSREEPNRRLVEREGTSSWRFHCHLSSISWFFNVDFLHENCIFLSFYFAFLWLLVKLNVYSYVHHLHFLNQFSSRDLRDLSIDWKSSLYIYDISLLHLFIASSPSLTFIINSVYNLLRHTEFLNYYVVKSTFFCHIFFYCFREPFWPGISKTFIYILLAF